MKTKPGRFTSNSQYNPAKETRQVQPGARLGRHEIVARLVPRSGAEAPRWTDQKVSR